jgi:3-isopropylmalate/(R)-2-methylmalate dehydratase small subunit
VVAKSYARIFFRNAVNLALPVVICPAAVDAIIEGDTIDIDLEAGTVTAGGKSFPVTPLPEFMEKLFNMGGIVPYTQKRLKELGKL